MRNLLLLIVGLAALGWTQAARSKQASCPKPYSHCNLGKDGFINVHIVPHTHDDVGWLKTVDQYYYGANLGEQDARVQYILDTVIDELSKDPQKRFVYVEMAFFWRWWNEQNDATQQLVRTLVDEGRLEFVIGAWCMNDEATTYYQDIIDQQTLGLKFIQAEFGKCARPRAAWQIDPFGHSREQASLFAQFGFDALFLGRVDYQDKDYRTEKKTREMLWEASANLDGDTARLFTGILHNGYGPPDDFCFDQYCGDEPIMDDPNLDGYNVDQKVESFIRQTLEQANAYRTNNLVMTFGSDFQYSNAHIWFKNLDKAMYYINREQSRNGSKVNVFYSTTACYVNAIHNANITWPTKTDDFFPYAHRPHSFWTGYFTSRPALKNMVRRANNYLQVVRQLTAITDLGDQDTVDAIATLERAMGVAQHHDAVSGTERQHVANDYAKRLAHGMNKCLGVLNKALTGVFVGKQSDPQNPQFQHCPLVNISVCQTSETQNRFLVFVYNPLSRDISNWVRVPVVGQSSSYKITDENGQSVAFDLAPVYQETQEIPERDDAKADHELVFKSDLSALGFRLYTVEKSAKSNLGKLVGKKLPSRNVFASPFVIENENLLLEFDGQGNLIQVKNKQFNLASYVSQSYCIYKSMPGDNSKPEKQASGAYIFRPQNDSAECLKAMQYVVNKQSQFTEIHQVYNSWISQTIRLYAGATDVEFEWLVGPIYIDDKNGREIVMRFDSDLNSGSTFYTDSNGREILTRVVDYRPTWPLNQSEHVSGNYYPVNSRIFIRDEQQPSNQQDARQLTLVTDRSQGGSSVKKGSVELMVHRRTLHDDSLGVSEPINEPGQDNKGLRAKGVVNLILSDVLKSASYHRELAHRVNNQPLVLFGSESMLQYKNLKINENNQLLSVALPPNLHLLTLMRDFYDADDGLLNSLIVRIEHFYEKREDSLLSLPVTINLLSVFGKNFNVTNIEELALGANIKIEELNERLDWQADSNSQTRESTSKKIFKPLKDTFYVQFDPMQIRTFRIWYLPKRHLV